MNLIIWITGFLWFHLSFGETVVETSTGYCGVADHEDPECFNLFACDDFKITLNSAADTNTCSSSTSNACTEELDAFEGVLGECVVNEMASTEVLGSDMVKDFCAIFIEKGDCLSKTGTWCAWEQHCAHNEDLCYNKSDCETGGSCTFDDIEGTCLPNGGTSYLWDWVAAACMLVLTCIGLAIPFILGRLLGSMYQTVAVFLSTISGATLFSLATIHLLSEGILYENMTTWSLCHTWITFTITFVFNLVSFAFVRYTLSGSDFAHVSYVGLTTKYAGVILHCLQEGLVVGLQSESVLLVMTIVIVIHKILFAIALGHELQKNWSAYHLFLSIVFVLSAPAAVIAAAYLAEGVNNEFFAHLNAFSAAAILAYSYEQFLDLRDYYRFKNSTSEKVNSEIKSMSSSLSSTSSDEEEHTELEMEPSLKERSVSLDDEIRKRARSTFLKRSLIAMSAHYLIMFAVSIGVFFLMVWHISVHDHGAGGHGHGHEHEH